MMLVISCCVFSFETLIPSEAHGVLSSLLDVVSRLSHLLPRADHVLSNLSEFLHAFKIAALLDMPDFRQVRAWPRSPRGNTWICCVFVFAPFASISLFF